MKRGYMLVELLVVIALSAPWPRGYAQQDSRGEGYAFVPFAEDYAQRRQALIDLHTTHPKTRLDGIGIRLAAGFEPDEAVIRKALDNMNQRQDRSDFRLNGILRILYQFGDSPLLSGEIRKEAREAILNYKYWPDEPGVDSMCTWSENHHIMFAAGAYLAGQLFPDDVFTNSGQTGREKMAIFRPRVLRWLDLRFRSGFSEWLSNVYYNEDIPPLLNLVDFAEDPELSQRAAMVLDLVIADMALNSYHGAFASTHGRSYEREKKWADREHTRAAQYLLFGMNGPDSGNMSSCGLALSGRYRMPRVFYDIATDFDHPEMVNRQRIGIRIQDARKWGLDFNRFEDGMAFLSLEACFAPKTANLMARMLDEYNWWENDFLQVFSDNRRSIERARAWHVLPLYAWRHRRDVNRNMRPEVNIYTYRTPDYMLSSAQDYRKGYGGDQQHIWQATLAPGAVCFTTNPAVHEHEGLGHRSPSYWTGSGELPRAAQIKNVSVIVYNISDREGLRLMHNTPMTHAWLPKDQFDAVIEQDHWIFTRKGGGYLALWSREPWRWQTEEGEDKDRELIADGAQNIWICELGRRETDGSFEQFVERIQAAAIETEGLGVRYESPSQGCIEFGWRGPLRQDGRRVPLDDYPRYGNPYCEAPFPGEVISFRLGGEWLLLDWNTLEREASSYCGE